MLSAFHGLAAVKIPTKIPLKLPLKFIPMTLSELVALEGD
jgi:hypothetical protein